MKGGTVEGGNGGVADAAAARSAERARFRRVLIRVFVVQAVTLALLWLLQSRYHGG